MAAARADTQDTGVFKSEVSRAPLTTMPAFTVDEQKSAKTHTLFMGADIAINLDKDLYSVHDVVGSNWVIDVNGRQREISAKEAPLNLKITPRLKLTEVSATINGYRRVPAYSFDNDPSVRITRGLTHAASISNDLLAVAENAQYVLDTVASRDMGPMSLFAQSDLQFGQQAQMVTAETTPAMMHPPKATPGSSTPPVNTLVSSTLPPMYGANGTSSFAIAIATQGAHEAEIQTENGNQPAGKIATSGLDAMDVEFDIRAGKLLQNPYVVTITRFRTPGSKPGVVQNLIFAQSINPIDEHLSHVHFVEDGFPFNYELIDFQLHIYNRGEEIATNISPNRVELTRDEAFQYVRMEYIGSHRGETLPASPVMGKLPADLPEQLAAGKYAKPFYVSVSKDGIAYDAYSDAACTRRIEDEYLESVVKRIRFKPALSDGRPVEGVVTLNLRQLAI